MTTCLYAIKDKMTDLLVTGYAHEALYIDNHFHSRVLVALTENEPALLYRNKKAARKALKGVHDRENYLIIPLELVED